MACFNPWIESFKRVIEIVKCGTSFHLETLREDGTDYIRQSPFYKHNIEQAEFLIKRKRRRGDLVYLAAE